MITARAAEDEPPKMRRVKDVRVHKPQYVIGYVRFQMSN